MLRALERLVLIASLAGSSAYTLPPRLSRRTVARAVATTPLVAAAAAWADADNRFLGVAKSGGAGQVEKYGTTDKSVGRQAVVDDAGAAVPITSNPAGMPSTAQYTAKEASQLPQGDSAIRIGGNYRDNQGAEIKVQTIGTNKLLVTDMSLMTRPGGAPPSGLVLARGRYDGRAVELGGLSGTDDGLKGTAVQTGIIFQDGTVWKKF